MIEQISTCHFASAGAAFSYYKDLGFTPKDVLSKIKEKEIYIGKPPAKKGYSIYLLKSEQRYFYYK